MAEVPCKTARITKSSAAVSTQPYIVACLGHTAAEVREVAPNRPQGQAFLGWEGPS